MRMLPPALGVCSPALVISSLFRLKGHFSSETIFKEFHKIYPDHDIILSSCGKSALFLCLRYLQDSCGITAIVVSAFTCPDIVIVALTLGLEVLLLDINQDTLELVIPAEQVSTKHKKLAVILCNLYGLPDSLEAYHRLEYLAEKVYIIDDASQSFLSMENNERIGGRAMSCFGILSFGRGKAISALGGAAIVVTKSHNTNLSIKTLKHQDILSKRSKVNALIHQIEILCYAQLMWFFQNPYLYSIPAHLPFLGLGKTPLHWNWSNLEMTIIQQVYAYVQLLRMDILKKEIITRSKRLSQSLSNLNNITLPLLNRNNSKQDTCLTRYPIIFNNKIARDRAFRDLHSRGLGPSKSYIRAIKDFPGLEDVGNISCIAHIDGARHVANCILTLPTHSSVTERDIQNTVEIIRYT